MYPFVHLTKSDCLMTSHCIYSSFDEIPSTLSKVLLTDVLRNEIGFNGLIISDGMEMNAIKDYYGLGEGSVMALNAGCDLLLLCHEYELQKEALIIINYIFGSIYMTSDNIANYDASKKELMQKYQEFKHHKVIKITYDKKYDIAYENLLRYLKSSTDVLDDTLKTWLVEIKSKQTLIERNGIK